MNFQFLKTLSFLLLLLSVNPAVAFAFPEDLEDVEKKEVTHDISEDSPELSTSTLTDSQFNQSPRLLLGGVDNFYFRSTYTAREANLYITFSRSIDPSLDVAVIIFPFHSFL